jgi:hypothetical protein
MIGARAASTNGKLEITAWGTWPHLEVPGWRGLICKLIAGGRDSRCRAVSQPFLPKITPTSTRATSEPMHAPQPILCSSTKHATWQSKLLWRSLGSSLGHLGQHGRFGGVSHSLLTPTKFILVRFPATLVRNRKSSSGAVPRFPLPAIFLHHPGISTSPQPTGASPRLSPSHT